MSTDKGRSPVSPAADDDPAYSDCREGFEAGDKNDLLWVIMDCAQWNTRMPHWVREAFYEFYWSGAFGEFKSWDDVFGKPWGRGQRRAAITQLQRLPVWARIRMLHEEEGAAIDNRLFERVGKEFGLSRSVVSRLYYEIDRRHRHLSPEDRERFGL